MLKNSSKGKFQVKGTLFIFCFVLYCLCLSQKQVNAQEYHPTKEDKKALKSVIVEKFYTATDNDVKDSVAGKLAKGSVTYRIYLDLLPGYKLQTVYGSKRHPLCIETSTVFFNDTIHGHEIGDMIVDKIINRNNVALDSWLTMGAATNFHNGVVLKEDTDGSVIKGKAQLAKVDGMLYGNIFKTVYYGDNIKFFKDSVNPKRFYMENFAWANLLGVQGAAKTNKILIAQLTTEGVLSFELNVQIGTPNGEAVRFVAKNPEKDEIEYKMLVYKSKK